MLINSMAKYLRFFVLLLKKKKYRYPTYAAYLCYRYSTHCRPGDISTVVNIVFTLIGCYIRSPSSRRFQDSPLQLPLC
jgi:hypothetical protein